jgi:hypothetical protein
MEDDALIDHVWLDEARLLPFHAAYERQGLGRQARSVHKPSHMWVASKAGCLCITSTLFSVFPLPFSPSVSSVLDSTTALLLKSFVHSLPGLNPRP